VPLFSSPPHGARCCLCLLLGVLLLGLAGSRRTAAQAPLRYANDNTTVREISFRFVDHRTFDPSRLRKQIATTAPGTVTRLRNWFAFLPGVQARQTLFDPVTLQKDVVRLRQFYRQNGFPTPDIDYPASQLDTTDNRIHVVFTIREGRSLEIRETEFLNAEGTAPATTALPDPVRKAWTQYRDERLQIGGRYTDFKQTQIEDQVESWLRNRGFAFAETQSAADTTQYAVDLKFFVDPGPRAVVSEVRIAGNESVTAPVVLRELPFSIGDRFSADAVREGQQKLFDLNLFRVALADVPEQPRDSTVVVRYRVRETKLRAFSGQIGYDTQLGTTLEGSWRHRNFYGDARTFLVNLTAETGLPENPPEFLPGFLTRSSSQALSRQFRASVTLRQPYLFSEDLSGSVAPFIQERLNPALPSNPTRFLDLNERQFGINSTLVYDFLPYRTLSLQHSVARTQQFLVSGGQNTVRTEAPLSAEDDLFNKSVFTLSGTFGDADDFINPTKGYIFRPTAQLGGFFFESGVEFVKLSGELSGYLPLSDYVELAGRAFAGSMWPFDESRANLTLPASPSDKDLRQNRAFQNRLSDYFLYAGGGSDVRGWGSRLAGGKVIRTSSVLQEGFVYRPTGARTKIGASLEARFPLPGLGSSWRTAAFVDGAYLTAGPFDLTPPPGAALTGPDGDVIGTDASQVLVGTGAGLRYQTPFGFLRIDLAYKLTPDPLDLRTAGKVGKAVTGPDPQPLSEVETRFIRRFRLHFGIGRSF
jgi:outer membrane protein insertion porin family